MINFLNYFLLDTIPGYFDILLLQFSFCFTIAIPLSQFGFLIRCLSYKLPNGKPANGPCGGILTDSVSGEKRTDAPTAIKTTQPKVLKFLKKWAITCKTYDDEGHIINAIYDHCAIS